MGGLLIGFAFISSCAPKESEQDILLKINAEVLANSKAYKTLGDASETIGHRLTGSENGQKAEQYAYDLLKSYGFEQVEFQEFEVEAWSRDSLALYIQGKSDQEKRKLHSVSLAHSPVSSEIKGELYDVGNGLVADFEAHQEGIKGKVALIYIGNIGGNRSENLHRSEKTSLAIQYGATGAVFINQVIGRILLTGTASVTGSLIPIPAVSISYEDGMELREQLKKEKIEVHIQMANKSGMIKARNVIATLKGSELPDEKVIVGGHLDSWDLATGAMDNGIGSFTVLDMARTFKALDIKPKRSIQFVMFMGEEQGLLGSKYMVKTLEANGGIEQIAYVMNIDMTGNPIGFDASGLDSAVSFITQAGENIKAIDSVFTNKVNNSAGLHSDHQPFMLAGVPVIGLVGNLDPKVYGCYHSNCDNFSLINEAHIKNSVRFCSMMLYQIANAEEIPVKKMSSEETEQFLINQDLKSKLILGGDWKWN